MGCCSRRNNKYKKLFNNIVKGITNTQKSMMLR